ncbi:prepilin-type N-terminal cleavage/methylation domain-containing protein [Cellvibrio fibrivorans]|uniref:Prepilin-type N-terminal cleavage/methylation domain-containing protein n=1 Tax=Cellvibrio fibrivorans TaxID=126350 RepID=A0ABU1UU62_9GAMM|nr:prepilin-type N-terminal cleavage/methylation domain-containing protein [Cellvibrio fibrivorans]MDR7088707.1 prepilin-type N-terminal cleavage/methylation domain-containing protein [Cellvibrio fibrivorans]
MNQRKGFTLVEILVVLILLGLTSALVLPKFPALYERFKSRAEQDNFYQALGALGLKAYTQQKTITLNATSARELVEVPDDWELHIETPIVYKPSGLCLGGDVSYTAKGFTTTIKLAPPYCEARRP